MNMENLRNNKIYNVSRLVIIAHVLCSLIAILFRIVLPDFSHKIYFASSYFVWVYGNIGVETYQSAGFTLELLTNFSVCLIFILIYTMLYFVSKKRLGAIYATLIIFLIDTAVFVVDAIFNGRTLLLVVGLVFRLLFIIVLLIGVRYAIIGFAIEQEEDEEQTIPNVKYINPDYKEELKNKNRKIILRREKNLLNSYIYLECLLDGHSVGYLKDNDALEIEADANSHFLLFVAYFETIQPIEVKIGESKSDIACDVFIQNKKLFKKAIEISKGQI